MIRVDETALICDFAETYHIYDWRRLPLQTAASLASGLRLDSRIMMRRSGMTIPLNTLLLATAVDRLGLLLWLQTKDGSKGRNRPTLIIQKLQKSEEDDVVGFASGKDFERERKWILEVGTNGN